MLEERFTNLQSRLVLASPLSSVENHQPDFDALSPGRVWRRIFILECSMGAHFL